MEKIAEIIARYESGEYIPENGLIDIQRDLACQIFHLTRTNIEAFQKWNSIVYQHDGSNASGEVLAHQKVPELRMTRKLLEACKSVAIAIQSEIKHNEL